MGQNTAPWLHSSGSGLGLGQQVPVDTSPAWGLGSCLPAPSHADPFTNTFISLRGLHLPPSGGSSAAWILLLIKLAQQ